MLDNSVKLKVEEWKNKSGYAHCSKEESEQTIAQFKTKLENYRKDNAVDLSREYICVRKGCYPRGE